MQLAKCLSHISSTHKAGSCCSYVRYSLLLQTHMCSCQPCILPIAVGVSCRNLWYFEISAAEKFKAMSPRRLFCAILLVICSGICASGDLHASWWAPGNHARLKEEKILEALWPCAQCRDHTDLQYCELIYLYIMHLQPRNRVRRNQQSGQTEMVSWKTKKIAIPISKPFQVIHYSFSSTSLDID